MQGLTPRALRGSESAIISSSFSQVKERKDTLAHYETLDNGKPISEAAWDMVRAQNSNLECLPLHDLSKDVMYGRWSAARPLQLY